MLSEELRKVMEKIMCTSTNVLAIEANILYEKILHFMEGKS